MNEQLHVYSAGCVWHGPIEKCGKTTGEPSIPCCPHCGSVLFQCAESTWQNGIDGYKPDRYGNYRELLDWIEKQPRCFPSLDMARLVKEAK